MASTFSRSYLAAMAAVVAALSAVVLVATGDRPAGIGSAEPGGLVLAAALFVVAGAAARRRTASVGAAAAALVVVAVLAFLALTTPGPGGTVALFEALALVLGVLFLVELRRTSVPSARR